MKRTLLISALVSISIIGCKPQPSIAASSLGSQGRTENTQAQEGIQKLQQAGDTAWAHFYKAEKLFKLGFLSDAETETLEAMRLMPKLGGPTWEEPALLRMLASIRFEQGRDADALAILKKGIAEDGTVSNKLLKRDLALAFAVNKDLTNATKYFDDREMIDYIGKDVSVELPKGENIAGLTARILLSVGLECRGHGDDEGGLKYFHKALKLLPTNGLVVYYTALTEQNLGRKVVALALYKTVPDTSSKAKKAKESIVGLERQKRQDPVEFEKIPPLPSEREAKKNSGGI